VGMGVAPMPPTSWGGETTVLGAVPMKMDDGEVGVDDKPAAVEGTEPEVGMDDGDVGIADVSVSTGVGVGVGVVERVAEREGGEAGVGEIWRRISVGVCGSVEAQAKVELLVVFDLTEKGSSEAFMDFSGLRELQGGLEVAAAAEPDRGEERSGEASSDEAEARLEQVTTGAGVRLPLALMA
jgi:hypothetical protein